MSFVRSVPLFALVLLVACEKHVEGEGCMEVAGTDLCRSYESVRPGDLYEACGAEIVEVTGEGTYTEGEAGAYATCCYPVQVVDGSCDDEE